MLSISNIKNPERYIDVADSLNAIGENNLALPLLQKIENHPSIIQPGIIKCRWHLVMGDCYDDKQEYRKSIQYYTHAISLLKLCNDGHLSIRVNYSLAGVYSDIDNYDSALVYLNKALAIVKSKPKVYFRYFKRIYNNLGLVYSHKCNYIESLNHYYKALEASEKEHDADGIRSTYNNLGNFYYDLSDYKKSLSYYLKSIQIIPSESTYANLGLIYSDLHKNDSAFFYIKKAIEIELKYDDKAGLAASYTILGNILGEVKQDDSALHYYNLSNIYATQCELPEVIQNNNYNIAQIYFERKRYNEAKKIALQNLELVKESDDLPTIADVYGQLKTIYSAIGNYKKAFEFQEKYRIYSDSARDANKSIEIKKIELTAEYKKKSSNDSLLHVQQTELSNLKHDVEIKKQRVLLFSFIAILIIVAFFSIIILKRYKVSVKQKEIINLQKNEMYSQKLLVEEKQKEILDSINYAKRIQYTLLAHQDFLEENLSDFFTFFKPKDIVSGDFYWATKHNNKFYLAVCDSTGHGVPGAFMSLLNIGFLSEAINEKGIEKPNKIFNYVRQRLIDNVSKEGQKDGFDGILVCIDQKNKEISYAAANNKPILIHKNELTILDSDRMPVGMGERKEEFKLHQIKPMAGDTLYFYTDGYADQFGGPKGKKFKYKTLNEFILSISHESLEVQSEKLKSNFDSWRGNLEQVDDICIIGVKI